MQEADIMQAVVTALTFKPKKVSEPTGWIPLTPFAAALISAIKPNVIVELGTHTGNSYFSMCQAVDELRLPTLCYAVDTWHGDSHAGSYDESVYRQVLDYNHSNYSRFSYLLRMTFDEAVSQFSDDSIDILHIDGFHTYESVKNDFQTWFRKVRIGGVILLHDICVRHDDFGVWRLWDDIQSTNPHTFSLQHAYGLGVLVKNAPIDLANIFLQQLTDKSLKQFWRCLFAKSGERALYESQLDQDELMQAQLFVSEDGNYSEALSQKISYEPNKVTILRFTALSQAINTKQICLRFDPANRTSSVLIKRISILQDGGSSPLSVLKDYDLKKDVTFNNELIRLIDSPLTLFASASDPQIVLSPFEWIGISSWSVEIELITTDGIESLTNHLIGQSDRMAALCSAVTNQEQTIELLRSELQRNETVQSDLIHTINQVRTQLEETVQTQELQESHQKKLQSELARRAQELKSRETELEQYKLQKETQLAVCDVLIERKNSECAELLSKNLEFHTKMTTLIATASEVENQLRQKLITYEEQVTKLSREIEYRIKEHDRFSIDQQERIRFLNAKMQILEKRLEMGHSSKSWRLTKPLRAIYNYFNPKVQLSGVYFYIDQAPDSAEVDKSFIISGWFLDEGQRSAKSIWLRIGSHSIKLGRVRRDDVKIRYPASQDTENVGFAQTIEIGRGYKQLIIEAETHDGRKISLWSKRLMLKLSFIESTKKQTVSSKILVFVLKNYSINRLAYKIFNIFNRPKDFRPVELLSHVFLKSESGTILNITGHISSDTKPSMCVRIGNTYAACDVANAGMHNGKPLWIYRAAPKIGFGLKYVQLLTVLDGSERLIRHYFATRVSEKMPVFCNPPQSLVTSNEPLVSIIIPVYNKVEYTVNCLNSILCSKTTVPYEVIIADDCSRDSTELILRNISGIVYIKNKVNLGFLKNCNNAAQSAKGKYLLFLNNDTELFQDTLEIAVRKIVSDSKIGALGAKLIMPNGCVQEAGSIMWNDGSCLGYQRGTAIDDYSIQFERECDYCSGAFLLTQTNLFQQAGKFDERYAPAYYEETDYCVWLHRQGYRVIYSPEIALLHYEFVSSESIEKAIEKQRKNQKIFFEKNNDFLNTKYFPSQANIVNARFSRKFQKKILYIDDRVPHHILGAGFPRSNDILHTILKEDVQVTVYPLQFPFESWSSVYSDVNRSIEVVLNLGNDGFRDFLLSRSDYFTDIFVSRPHNFKTLMRYLSTPELSDMRKKCRLIYDAEALFYLRDRAQLGFGVGELSLARVEQLRQEELSLIRQADIVSMVSGYEKNQIQSELEKNNLHVLGHMLEPKPSSNSFEKRIGFLFLGTVQQYPSPNADSLLWFVTKVWPLIYKELKENAKLVILGKVECEQVSKLQAPGIVFSGSQKHIESYFEEARCFVAPTRYAAGLPHKVQHAASAGLPVIATDLLVRQLQWTENTDIMGAPASDPELFACKCIELHENFELWKRIRENALKRIQEECSRSNFNKAVQNMFC